MSLASSITLLAALFNPAPAATAREKETGPQPLPIELTAFGDIYYSRQNPGSDDFHIGSLEVDIALKLVPYVSAFGAIAYDPQAESMTLASFVVDSGLWGKDEHAFFKSSVIESSGVILGKFDVPFGVAYLQYGSPDNRLVTQPAPVVATHNGWNDLGVQVYASTPLVDALGYFVNGSGLPESDPGRVDAALGGRVGLKPFGHFECACALELGGSAARSFGPAGTKLTLLGADISATVGELEVKSELIQLRQAGALAVRGFYTQGVYMIDPVFFGGRYAVTTEAQRITERTVTATAGLEIFPQGELRVAYERGLEQQADTLFVQIVGGSSWKPTGLRR